MLKTLGIAALAAAISLAGPALAEEGYWSYTEDGSGEDTMYVAWVSNARDFEMGVDCSESFGDRSIYLITDEPWEDTTSYAPEVPVTFTINGTDSAHTFLFEKTSDNQLAIAQYEIDYVDEVPALILSLERATGDIIVSFFTTSVVFSAESIAGAMADMHGACYPA